ncbi:MAG: iron-containing alcohol dehydrogenase, partial [Pseudomonadota bacterium]
KFLRERDADIIVTIGGGTPLDTVKTALICLAEDIENSKELDRFAIYVDDDGQRVTPAIANPPIRQIAVPTTLSGAEFSDLAGCVDPVTRIKNLFSGPQIGAASVILDPSLTVSTPRDLWLSTGIRAVDHAVESICSAEPHPFADAGAFHALRLFAKSLPRNAEQPEDVAARLDSQTAVWLACAGLNRVAYGASHGIGHQVGAQANVPHGFTSCVLLPSVMRFNHTATAERQELISDAFGAPARPAADLVSELISGLGLPTRLRDVGVSEDQLDAIAEGSLQNAWVRGNVVPIDRAEQVRTILDAAF